MHYDSLRFHKILILMMSFNDLKVVDPVLYIICIFSYPFFGITYPTALIFLSNFQVLNYHGYQY